MHAHQTSANGIRVLALEEFDLVSGGEPVVTVGQHSVSIQIGPLQIGIGQGIGLWVCWKGVGCYPE